MNDRNGSAGRLRAARRGLGLQQSTVAASVGISRQSYVGIEAGHMPNVVTAIAIARLLRSSVEALFGEPTPIEHPNGIVELSQRVAFRGSHRLDRPGQPDAAGSRNWHGHDYQVRIVLRGVPDPVGGMVCDIGDVKRLFDPLREELERTSMDDVPDLGPSTIENLARWIHSRLLPTVPLLHRVEVGREAHGDLAVYPLF